MYKPLVQGTDLLHTEQFVSTPRDSVLPQGYVVEYHVLFFHVTSLFPHADIIP